MSLGRRLAVAARANDAAVPCDGSARGCPGPAAHPRRLVNFIGLPSPQPAPACWCARRRSVCSRGHRARSATRPRRRHPRVCGEAIAAHHHRQHGIEVSPTTWSSPLVLRRLPAFLAAFEAGDVVAMAPGYPATAARSRRSAATWSRSTPARRPASSPRSSSWLRSAPPARVIVASPANPTGTMLLPTSSPRSRRGARSRGCS